QDEVRLLDLARRDVHAEEEVGTIETPAGGVAAGFGEDPATDRQGRAVLLGALDEVARRDHPTLGVLPADERLEAGRLARLQRHDRLVDEAELAQLDPALELGRGLVGGGEG